MSGLANADGTHPGKHLWNSKFAPGWSRWCSVSRTERSCRRSKRPGTRV